MTRPASARTPRASPRSRCNPTHQHQSGHIRPALVDAAASLLHRCQLLFKGFGIGARPAYRRLDPGDVPHRRGLVKGQRRQCLRHARSLPANLQRVHSSGGPAKRNTETHGKRMHASAHSKRERTALLWCGGAPGLRFAAHPREYAVTSACAVVRERERNTSVLCVSASVPAPKSTSVTRRPHTPTRSLRAIPPPPRARRAARGRRPPRSRR